MNIHDTISEETQFKQPPALVLEADFQEPEQKTNTVQTEINPENNDFNQIKQPEQKQTTTEPPQIETAAQVKEQVRKMPVDFTASFIIDSLDTIQSPLFYSLNLRKQRKKRFKSKEETDKAADLAELSPEELKKLPPEDQLLASKYNLYKARMQKIYREIEFTAKEKEKLKVPLAALVKEHNFDIPPGLAFTIAILQVTSDRIIDLIID